MTPSRYRWRHYGLALLCAAGAQAQNLKPGLWEMSSKMQSGSGEMEKAMVQIHTSKPPRPKPPRPVKAPAAEEGAPE